MEEQLLSASGRVGFHLGGVEVEGGVCGGNSAVKTGFYITWCSRNVLEARRSRQAGMHHHQQHLDTLD